MNGFAGGTAPPDIGDAWWTQDAPDEIRQRAAPFFETAFRLEEAGRFDEAFAALAQGNRIKNEGLRADTWIAMHAQGVTHLKAIFTPAFLAQHATSNPERAPIFIVGMPRSGSTLVEQILATHPRVQGIGETLALGRLAAEAYPFNLLGRLDPRGMADEYLRRIRAEGWRKKPRFTDKMLANYTAIGHIHLMFPKAVILHMVRDPIDSCFSCYRGLFDHDAHLRFSYDLRSIGRHYQAYRDMMNHWRQVLVGRVIDVRHEELVADLEGRTRWLLEACGLDWDERCLRYYDNPREVLTASRLQVRRPIFTSSIGRWRRYRRHLGPLFEALGPYAPSDA